MSLRTLLLLLVLLSPLAAWADLPGVEHYERGEYEQAARSFQGVLATLRCTRQERGLARAYLAASLQALGLGGEAKEQLELLARECPEQHVDPALFPPELVELAEAMRLRVQAEQQLARHNAWHPPERAPEVARPAPAFRLRPEVSGFVEGRREAWGVGVGVLYGWEMLEVGVRALASDYPVLQLEAGLRVGSGAWQPRLGLRGNFSPRLGIFGGGAVAGARVSLTPGLVALADVSGDYFALGPTAGPELQPVVVMLSVGIGFDVPLW